MKRQQSSPPHITIRVSGKLFEGHLSAVEQVVQSAGECSLWPVLSLADLDEVDRTALLYLMDGEDRRFAITSCPQFIRDWMDRERQRAAA